MAGLSQVGRPRSRERARMSALVRPASTRGLRTECRSAARRPGRRAAAEHGVRSPLIEAGLTKEDIRSLSKERGLPTWDKPAMACLSSRIPYGSPVTVEALDQIEAAEAFLRSLGLRQLRVRHHGAVARIELDEAGMAIIMSGRRQAVVERLKALGFRYVTLDLAGFRSGSMNEVLKQP